MRDLHARGLTATRNGDGPPEESEPAEELSGPALDHAIRMARQDNRIASVAVMMLDATEKLYPLLAMLSKLSLRWAALALSAWLSFYAMQHATVTWERGAIAAFFLLGSSLIWWKA